MVLNMRPCVSRLLNDSNFDLETQIELQNKILKQDIGCNTENESTGTVLLIQTKNRPWEEI